MKFYSYAVSCITGYRTVLELVYEYLAILEWPTSTVAVITHVCLPPFADGRRVQGWAPVGRTQSA